MCNNCYGKLVYHEHIDEVIYEEESTAVMSAIEWGCISGLMLAAAIAGALWINS